MNAVEFPPTDLEEALREVEPDLWALPPERCRKVTVDVGAAAMLAVGYHEQLAPQLPELRAALPAVDWDRLARLGTYAKAAIHANAVFYRKRSAVDPQQLLTLQAQGATLRDRLLLGSDLARARGVPIGLPAVRHGRPSRLQLAQDLIGLATHLRAHLDDPRQPCTAEELDRADWLGGRLIHAEAAHRRGEPPETRHLREQRRRAFTLLADVYEELGHALAFLRRAPRGGPTRRLPSLFAKNRGGRRRGARPASANESADAAAPPSAVPAM